MSSWPVKDSWLHPKTNVYYLERMSNNNLLVLETKPKSHLKRSGQITNSPFVSLWSASATSAVPQPLPEGRCMFAFTFSSSAGAASKIFLLSRLQLSSRLPLPSFALPSLLLSMFLPSDVAWNAAICCFRALSL